MHADDRMSLGRLSPLEPSATPCEYDMHDGINGAGSCGGSDMRMSNPETHSSKQPPDPFAYVTTNNYSTRQAGATSNPGAPPPNKR
jgi:hypothetical protein